MQLFFKSFDLSQKYLDLLFTSCVKVAKPDYKSSPMQTKVLQKKKKVQIQILAKFISKLKVPGVM